MTTPDMAGYFAAINHLLLSAEVTNRSGVHMNLAASVGQVVLLAQETHRDGNTVLFIGNGGSAAIASHMAIDFSKNAGIRALAFNDGAALTCLGNDFDFSEIFSRQLFFHGRPNDLLIAISSSGRSPDILEAVSAARSIGLSVVTFSGFSPSNPLRSSGDLNFYIPSELYGIVEISHHVLCHAIVDHIVAVPKEFSRELSLHNVVI
jgi:D-sedoheptulose 7-phosphate isomerase